MPYRNGEGYLEGVLFLFYRDGNILIEHRPRDGDTETFIPNGKIEESDFGGNDYRLNALAREVSEEFCNSVRILKYTRLGEFHANAVQIKFYGYLITEWEGTIPAYTVEGNVKFADLEWIPIEEYAHYLKFESAIFFIDEARKMMG